MDDFDLPEDLDDVEVIYLDGDIEFEGEDMENAEDYDNMPEDTEDLVIEDLANLTFTKHTKSVFTCDLSNDSQLAVTGGEDDNAYVWSTTTGELIFDCTGHKDSVISVSFNHDSQLIATGDMSGMIQVWDVKEKKLVWCYEGDDLEWLSWHPLVNILISGSKSGDIYIWQIPQGNCKVLASHGAPCTCGKILPDGKRLVAGYGDTLVKLWDIKSTTSLWQYSDTENDTIQSLEISKDGSLISIAPSSHILKAADGKAIAKLLVEGETEIEAHAFNNELNVAVTGSILGQLCVWDLGRQVIRHRASIECAVTVLRLGTDGRAFVGATDGAIYLCDIKTGALIQTLTGHRTDIFDLCISQDGKTVLSASDDGTAKIFKINS